MEPIELEQLTLAHFPEAFLRALTECVFLARKTGWDMCRREFAQPEGDNVLGLNVRGKLEGLLRPAAERHGLRAEVLKQPGQPWYHTEVRSGPLVLTASTVIAPGAMVDLADYRKGLAQSNQLRLWEDDPPEDAPLYILLIHSRSRWLPSDVSKYGHLPGSIYLAYPAADFEYYVHDINLMDRYPDIVRKYVPQDWDEEAIVKYLMQTRRSATA